MTTTTTQLRRRANQLDRLNRQVAVALTALRRGATLHLTYARPHPIWELSSGGRISQAAAKVLIQNPNVIGVGDALFKDLPAQTWRWSEVTRR
jgi:hypothetical protein